MNQFPSGLARRPIFASALFVAVLAQPPLRAAAFCINSAAPFSINSSGEIAGTSGILRGFVRSKDGSITTFLVDDFGTRAVDINSAGTIVGTYLAGIGFSHGYVRAADGAITKFDVPGALDTEPAAINPAGTITGFYDRADNLFSDIGFVRDADGSTVTFTVPGSVGFTIPTDINPDGV